MHTPPAELAGLFQLLQEPDWTARFNIAPTQPVPAIRQVRQGRKPTLLRWGLVPSWAKDPSIGSRMINARGETVADKPSFRGPLRYRRCLIPADGFYEWAKGEGGTKQPYYVTLCEGRPFAFAGLWEHWEGLDGAAIESCTIITTQANEVLADIHERMPVILHRADYDRWLDPGFQDTNKLQQLLAPYPAHQMGRAAVSTFVNSPRNESAACIEPLPS